MNQIKKNNTIDFQPLISTKNLLTKFSKEGAKSELEEMGGIQAFEIAYELSWKIMKKVLASKGIEVYSPKETFRKAAAEGLIDNFESWGVKYLETRNLTTHSYESDVMEDIWAILPNFLNDLTILIKKMQEEINQP